MNARAGSGWQTALADLSLILFMVTAGAVSTRPSPPAQAGQTLLPALSEPVAVWRDEPGAPPLAQWLASAGRDPNLRLTLLASSTRVDAALALAAGAGRPVRIVIEGQGEAPVAALLTYDQAPALARPLQPGRD